jgi:hypothetical protein
VRRLPDARVSISRPRRRRVPRDEKGFSYFPFSGTTLATLAADVKTYDQTKSALHFDPLHPLPVALVRKLLKARIAESEGGAPAKSARRAASQRAPARRGTKRTR